MKIQLSGLGFFLIEASRFFTPSIPPPTVLGREKTYLMKEQSESGERFGWKPANYSPHQAISGGARRNRYEGVKRKKGIHFLHSYDKHFLVSFFIFEFIVLQPARNASSFSGAKGPRPP